MLKDEPDHLALQEFMRWVSPGFKIDSFSSLEDFQAT